MTSSKNERQALPASVIAQYTLVILAIITAALFIWQIKEALLAAFGAVILAVIITGMARGLRSILPLSRSWSLVSVGVIAIATIGLFILFLGPQISNEFQELSEKIPRRIAELQETIREWPMGEQLLDGGSIEMDQIQSSEEDGGGSQNQSSEQEESGSENSSRNDGQQEGSGAENGDQNGEGEGSPDDSSNAQQEESGDTRGQGTDLGDALFQAGATFIDIVSMIVVVLFMGMFFAADPELYKNGIILLVTSKRVERVNEALETAGNALWQWLTGQLIAMLFVGTTVTIGLLIIGVPLALILGIIAGVFDFVPYIGPIAAFFPAILLAFAEGPEVAFFTSLLYLAVQQLEGNIVTPIVQHHKVSIPPALVILSIVAFGLVFGVPGVILATPLAVVSMVLIGMLYVQDVLGKDISIPGHHDQTE